MFLRPNLSLTISNTLSVVLIINSTAIILTQSFSGAGDEDSFKIKLVKAVKCFFIRIKFNVFDQCSYLCNRLAVHKHV